MRTWRQPSPQQPPSPQNSRRAVSESAAGGAGNICGGRRGGILGGGYPQRRPSLLRRERRLPESGRMDLASAVRRAGGVMPTRRLRHIGFSDYAIRQAVATRSVYRVRKGWVAMPGADQAVIRAVRAHGI